jgi:hypothetical protein
MEVLLANPPLDTIWFPPIPMYVLLANPLLNTDWYPPLLI